VDNDIVVVAAGHSVLWDIDCSAWTNGIAGLTVTGHATDPAMLYFKDGTSGWLKIKTGTTIKGTQAGFKGRILANSDGAWATITPVSNTYKAIIDLKGTAQIDATYAEMRMYAADPTYKYVTAYYDKYAITGVNLVNGTITLASSHGWAAGRSIRFRAAAGGVLPGGLSEDVEYYVTNPVATTLQLSAYGSTGITMIPTDAGSGTVEIYSGYSAFTGVKTLNIFEDVTGDLWTTTAEYNAVVMVPGHEAGNITQYQHRTTITDIQSNNITLNDALPWATYAGTKIYYVSRNVAIRTNATTHIHVVYKVCDSIFACELHATGTTVNTFYGYGISTGSNNVMSGIMNGFTVGIYACTGGSMTGIITSCSSATQAYNYFEMSGLIAGCAYAYNANYFTIMSGTIDCCFAGVSGNNNKVTGLIKGCNSGVSGYGTVFTGRVVSCNSSCTAVDSDIRGLIYGCNTGFTGSLCRGSGTISNCHSAFGTGYGNVFTGILKDNKYELNISSQCLHTLINAVMPYTATIIGRTTLYYFRGRINCINMNGVENANKIYDMFGDVVYTECAGNGNAPGADPNGGHDYCLETSNIQYWCGISYGTGLLRSYMRIIDKCMVWLEAGEHTLTYKLQTTYAAGIAAGNLVLSVGYLASSIGGMTITTNDTQTVAARTGKTDWTQSIAITFTQAIAGWAQVTLDLVQYESGKEVYVYPIPDGLDYDDAEFIWAEQWMIKPSSGSPAGTQSISINLGGGISYIKNI